MSVNSNKKILDASKLSLILSRLASQIFENHLDFSDVVLIGIQPRGKILSKKICNILNETLTNQRLTFDLNLRGRTPFFNESIFRCSFKTCIDWFCN